ncbi:MAG: tetratricopeptide repeat protein [Thermodesulfobacteriota bacterium]
MTWLHRLKSRAGLKKKSKALFRDITAGHTLTTKDTQTAINDLSRVVKNNPDAVEIYLALGNLYRSRGDIERALHIRQNIIARPNLDEQFKARAWFELGIDFKRAGLFDRALSALENARAIAGDEVAIMNIMASIFAESSDYLEAAEIYRRLNEPVPQAHYLVETARHNPEKDNNSKDKLLEKAIRIYPPSPEAWLEKICRDVGARNWKLFSKNFKQGLNNVSGNLRFILFQGLISYLQRPGIGNNAEIYEMLTRMVTEKFPKFDADPLLHFYHGVLALKSGNSDLATQSLEKSLVLAPDFWPARLELLSLTTDKQELSDSFCTQLDFFLKKARMVKRFICTNCGLKREQIFFICPRCHSWHSIAFRVKLND